MDYKTIYINIKKEFKELTQKDNYKIYSNKYFIPLEKIFLKRIAQACLEYELTDLNKLEATLLRYIRKCVKDKFPKYTRTVEYYIYGQNGKDCLLAEDYENNSDNLLEINDLEEKFKIKIL